MSSNPAVSVRNISKDFLLYDKPQHRLWQFLCRGFKDFYRHFHALKNISLEINKGEVVGIVGRNGSGKSTLLQIICGILQPSSGEIIVNGRISALLELGAGFNPEFTGIENVYLNGAIMGMSKKEIEGKLPGIIKFANIGEHVNQPVKTYSSGMFVRLAFAVAVASDPDILVVDEALAVGDEAFQRKCFSRIREIRDNGGTIIFVSHSASNIIELCDRAYMLDAGELVLYGNPKTVISNYHRFIFAPEEKRRKIRQELMLPRHQGFKGNKQDIGLTPESTLSYESQGALISDPKIINKARKKVTQLKLGGEYIFSYKVKFNQDAKSVKCGMLIKTASGVELGGTSSSSDKEAIKLVKKGNTLNVTFKFRAGLLPGTYFLNCGCSGIKDGERVFLHRIYDAVMFKVGAETNLKQTGIIDFGIQPKITVAKK